MSSPDRAPAAIRVLTADDDPIVRDLLRRKLRRVRNIETVGEAADGVEAVDLCRRLQPDVLLLDLLMPRLPGIAALRELTDQGSAVRVIVLCAFISKRQVVQALQLGARGILLKKSLDRLRECIDSVMRGVYWIDDRPVQNVDGVVQQVLGSTVGDDSAARAYGLTKRELQIISLVTLGRTNHEIGEALSISEETVKRHLANVFDKSGMSTRLEVAMFAVEHQLVAL